MSKWSHVICNVCWIKDNPGEIPKRIINKSRELCCFCGKSTNSGIFVRENPEILKCKGEHALW